MGSTSTETSNFLPAVEKQTPARIGKRPGFARFLLELFLQSHDVDRWTMIQIYYFRSKSIISMSTSTPLAPQQQYTVRSKSKRGVVPCSPHNPTRGLHSILQSILRSSWPREEGVYPDPASLSVLAPLIIAHSSRSPSVRMRSVQNLEEYDTCSAYSYVYIQKKKGRRVDITWIFTEAVCHVQQYYY